MIMVKKVISVVLSFAVCFALYSETIAADINGKAAAKSLSAQYFYAPVVALNESTPTAATDINKMAAALNKFDILQGDKGDYKLGDKAKRSEAAALIIRMLGKKNYVEQNAASLKNTKFVDVLSGSWYAPYVGYCVQNNILSGKTSNTFAPDEYTTEKQFLKMALCALGYVDGTDFDWSNIYQKAYSVGIVTDSSYASKIQDNTNYLRSEAVKVIFNALNTPKKGTQKKLVYLLTDEGAFTSGLIASSGIVGEDMATAIELITATALDRVEVDLNKNIQNVDTADVTIYDTAASGTVLAIKSLAFKDDKIQIITAGQIPGRSYTVFINKVTDINSNISGNLAGGFKGFTQQQVSSDFFRVQKVQQVSANVINVFFTHPVNQNSEIPAYFEIVKSGMTYVSGSSQNITIKKLQSAPNAVSILLKNAALTQGEVYSVKISGKLSSSYGVRLNEGFGDSMEFVSTAAQAGALDVALAQALSNVTVRIIFNREIDINWAGKKLNYTVYDQNNRIIDVTGAVVTDSGEFSGREVVLGLAAPLDKTKQYAVKMDFVPDVYKQSTIEGKSFTFSGAYAENTNLTIEQAVCEYNNSIILIFNKALDVITATNKSNYSILGINDGSFRVTPEKIYYSDQYGQFIVKLFLPAGKTLSNSQRYTVYASNLKDTLGSGYTAILKADFTGSGNSAVKPQIQDAVTVAKDTIKLYFKVEIAFDVNNISTTNYSLEYVENGETMKMAPIGVTYVDANTIILKFDELDQTKAYQIRFNTMNDYSGLYPRTSSDGGNTSAVRWGK